MSDRIWYFQFNFFFIHLPLSSKLCDFQVPRGNLEYRYTYHRNILIFWKFNKLAVPDNVKERISVLWGLFQKLIFIGLLLHRIDYNICTFFFFNHREEPEIGLLQWFCLVFGSCGNLRVCFMAFGQSWWEV